MSGGKVKPTAEQIAELRRLAEQVRTVPLERYRAAHKEYTAQCEAYGIAPAMVRKLTSADIVTLDFLDGKITNEQRQELQELYQAIEETKDTPLAREMLTATLKRHSECRRANKEVI